MIIKLHLGLGDAAMSYSAVEYLAKKHGKVKVMTGYPVFFENLKNVKCVEYGGNYDLYLRYTNKRHLSTTQYEDILSSAGISEKLPSTLKWSKDFSSDFQKNFSNVLWGKNICVVKEPSSAHMHKRQKNFRLASDPVAMQEFIDKNKGKYFFVSVGQDEVFLKRLDGIDLDLVNKLSLNDYITLVKCSDLIVSGFNQLTALALAFNKPFQFIGSKNSYKIKPHKVLSLFSQPRNKKTTDNTNKPTKAKENNSLDITKGEKKSSASKTKKKLDITYNLQQEKTNLQIF